MLTGPEEPKDQRRNDATTLERASDDDLYGAGAEKHLVDAKDDLWDLHDSQPTFKRRF